MLKQKTKYKITYGGWYQRTTLHLTEVHSLFEHGYSNLDLSKVELKNYQRGLDLASVSRESGNLEYVKAVTNSGIEIRYYEDGLYILELISDDIPNAEQILEDYYQNKFNQTFYGIH